MLRELNHRSTDGVDVSLDWDAASRDVLLTVADSRAGQAWQAVVPPADAGFAFRHPYAWAATSAPVLS